MGHLFEKEKGQQGTEDGDPPAQLVTHTGQRPARVSTWLEEGAGLTASGKAPTLWL